MVAAPYGYNSGLAGSRARERERSTRVIVWTGDLACALAAAWAAANLKFSGPQVHEGQGRLFIARWAARHSGAGRRGQVGAELPRDQGQVEDVYQRR